MPPLQWKIKKPKKYVPPEEYYQSLQEIKYDW